jgi:hypothetical protein
MVLSPGTPAHVVDPNMPANPVLPDGKVVCFSSSAAPSVETLADCVVHVRGYVYVFAEGGLPGGLSATKTLASAIVKVVGGLPQGTTTRFTMAK